MGCNTTKEVVPGVTEEKRPPDPQTFRISQSPVIPFIDDSSGEEQETVEAATKIQAAFRGHKTRKEMQKAKQAAAAEPEPSRAELEAEFSADDKELCQAATKIQASFRGHQSRRDTKDKSNVEELSEKMDQLQSKKEEEEELDIDLSDPDLHKAATKIQASFRGHKTRKEPKQ